MSKSIRSSKRQTRAEGQKGRQSRPEPAVIHAAVKSPLSPAAMGLASMMLASTAAAQEPPATPSQSSGAPRQETAAPQSATTLPQINVRSTPRRRARTRPAPAAPTAPVVAAPAGPAPSYQATQQTITRLPTPLLNTPQTVNVVTQRAIQDQGITTMEDALRTVPGITFNAGEGGQQGDSPIIRGFAARGDMFRDGLRDPGWYTRDLFSSDRVEVYKGPSAFAFGRGSTGGAINTVSKLPTGQTYVDTTIMGTSSAGYRMELDASGRNGDLSGRIGALYQDIPTPDRDNVYTKRWGVAPSVTKQFTPNTKLTVSYIYQGEESIPDYGHPYLPTPSYSSATGALTNPGYNGNGTPTTPVPVNRSNWYGVVAGSLADVVETDTHIATLKFEHDFHKDLKVSNATRYISVDRFARPTAPRSLGNAAGGAVTPGYPVDLMTIGRQHFQTETDNTLLVNQTDLTGKFYTGTFEHTFNVGLEVARETRDQQRARGMDANNLCAAANPACRTSLAAPVDTAFGGVFAGWNPATSSESVTTAVYAFDQIKLNDYWEVLGSVRYDNFSVDFSDPGNANPANRSLSRTDNVVSWRVGAVFHPTLNSSIYVAHGTSFNPSAEFGTLSGATNNAASVSLEPEKNVVTEAGVKVDLLNKRLSLAGAIFRIEKTNMRVPNDPALPAASQVLVLDGMARVQGVELSATGRLTDKWQIYAGYSYLDSEIAETTNLADLGHWLPSTPRNNFNFFTTYDITPRLTVGGGAQYQSEAFVNTANTAFVPEFWRVDLMAAYKVAKNQTIQLNIYNLTDELYYAQYYGGHAVPAAGRWASLSYRVRFEPDPVEGKKSYLPTKAVPLK